MFEACLTALIHTAVVVASKETRRHLVVAQRASVVLESSMARGQKVTVLACPSGNWFLGTKVEA